MLEEKIKAVFKSKTKNLQAKLIAGVAVVLFAGCGPRFIQSTYNPTPRLGSANYPVELGQIKKYLSGVLKYKCDELTVNPSSIKCVKNVTKCVSWDYNVAVPNCWDERHHPKYDEAYTTRKCGVVETDVCKREESTQKVEWEVVREKCEQVYAKVKEPTDGRDYFGSEVVVDHSSKSLRLRLGYHEADTARQIADVISAYCNVSNLK